MDAYLVDSYFNIKVINSSKRLPKNAKEGDRRFVDNRTECQAYCFTGGEWVIDYRTLNDYLNEYQGEELQ